MKTLSAEIVIVDTDEGISAKYTFSRFVKDDASPDDLEAMALEFAQWCHTRLAFGGIKVPTFRISRVSSETE